MRLFQPKGTKYYWITWYEGKTRRRETTKCTDKRAAEAYLKRRQRELADPSHRTEDSPSLFDALTAVYRDRRDAGRAAGTLNMYQTKAKQLVRVMGAETPVADVTAKVVDEFIEQRLDEGASRNTVHKELTTLRLALKIAKRRHQLRIDIDAIMPTSWSTGYKPRETYVRSVADLQALIAELLPDRGAHVCFIVATGCRRSESFRARRADVDLNGGSVRVRGTKTEGADKTIPIVGFMRPLLEHVLAVRGDVKGPLFRPWGNIVPDLADACRRAGIDRVTPNDLRRTTATWLRQGNVSPHLIAGVLRHKDSRMVERVYGRMPAESLGPAIKAELREEGDLVAIKPTDRKSVV